MMHTANPIRRVVNMLTMMQKKVAEEGSKAEDLFEKFECYCKKTSASLAKSLEEAQSAVPQLESAVEEGTAEKTQLEGDVAKAKADREAAKTTLAESVALRDKEAAEFEKATAEYTANIEAMTKALKALEKGMGGSFLQSAAAVELKRLIIDADISPSDRDIVISFLSGSQGEEDGYEPSSGEVIGIIKQMKDSFIKAKAEAEEAEVKAKEDFKNLEAAKKKEIAALMQAIQFKTERLGQVGMKIVNAAEELEDTKASIAKDTKFSVELKKNCETKAKEYEVEKKARADESLALSETMKILTEDDSFFFIQKALPSPSLLQLKVTQKYVLQQARSALKQVRRHKHDYHLDLLALALRGRKVDFGKVFTMIDNMVKLLKEEQTQDDTKKAFCTEELEKAAEDAASLQRKAENLDKSKNAAAEDIKSLAEEIDSLEVGIKELDASVAEASKQRKAEHDAYIENLSSNNAAIEVLNMAKDRMLKFYGASAFVQSSSSRKDSAGGTGVIALLDTIIKDISLEVEKMKLGEKDAQDDYEELMQGSTEKREADAKAVKAQVAAKVDLEAKVNKFSKEIRATNAEILAAAEYTQKLKGDCDWLLQNYDTRKEARAGEIDALGKAKDVLSGSDFS